MKKIVLSAVAAVAALTAGTGVASAQHFSWGPKAGMNVSTMSHTKQDAKVSFTAGLFGELRTNDWFAVSAEVLYSRQGVMDKWTVNDVQTKYRMKTHYLNVPVLANFYVTDRLALKTGVQAGFNLGARAIEKVGNTTVKNNVSDAFHTAEVAIPVGISYDLGPIVLDARYNFGVSHAMKEGSFRNNVFQLTAGIRF